jgi:hypothetical protein
LSNLIPKFEGEQTFSKKSIVIALATVLALLVVGVGGFIVHSNNVKAEKEAIRAAQALKAYQEELEAERIRNDVTWVPDGYYAWKDDKSVAYKWINNADNDCYSCRYWTLEVISKYGCTDGVYGELNILDKSSGTVISYTNDTLNYLGPFQAGRLSFETYIEGSITGDLTEINCR